MVDVRKHNAEADSTIVNRVWPPVCKHIASGDLPPRERLELTLKLTTVGEVPPDFQYEKGPDTVTVCAFCAGHLLGFAMKEILP